jgi:hypothetical protein
VAVDAAEQDALVTLDAAISALDRGDTADFHLRAALSALTDAESRLGGAG